MIDYARRFVSGAMVGVLAASLCLFAQPTVATNWGGSQCDATMASQCVAQDRWHYINYASALSGSFRSYMDYAGHLYDFGPACCFTDMVVFWDVAYGVENDVRVADTTNTSTTAHAWTRCASTPNATGSHGAGEDWCKPQLIFFNTAYSHVPDDWKAIACHETGHTMGLRHKDQTSGTTSCMRTYPVLVSGLQPPGPLMEPNSHDVITHLNAEY